MNDNYLYTYTYIHITEDENTIIHKDTHGCIF